MKRLNYTGRKKILREDIKISLHGDFGDKPVIDIYANLSGYGLPESSAVFLEPQWKTRFMRVPLGRAFDTVRRNSLALEQFDDAEGLDFRLKVVDEEKGLLLAQAENIRPVDKSDTPDPNHSSILPVASVDLSSYGVLWRIEFSDQKAVLQIERELGDKEQIIRSMWYRGFVLPTAMRLILLKIVQDDWDEELSDPDELSTRWLLFTKQIGAGVPERGADDYEEWLDDSARKISALIGVRSQIIEEGIMENVK